MRRNKFKKQLKKVQEIKASKSSPELIKYMVKKIDELENSQVHFIILEKGMIFSNYLKNNKHKLYNFISGKLGQKIIINGFDLDIKIDKSKGKQILQKDFNNYFCSKLRKNSEIKKIKISHSYSHAWSGLQFADILAWTCFQKFENNDNSFLELLSPEKREIYHTF